MSGLVMSTSTSGFDTWLAKPLPMTTDSYLRKKQRVSDCSGLMIVYQRMERFYHTCFWPCHSSTHRLGRPCLQHRLCLEAWTRTSWRVWASFWRPSTRKHTYRVMLHLSALKNVDEVGSMRLPIGPNWCRLQWWVWLQGCRVGIARGTRSL